MRFPLAVALAPFLPLPPSAACIESPVPLFMAERLDESDCMFVMRGATRGGRRSASAKEDRRKRHRGGPKGSGRTRQRRGSRAEARAKAAAHFAVKVAARSKGRILDGAVGLVYVERSGRSVSVAGEGTDGELSMEPLQGALLLLRSPPTRSRAARERPSCSRVGVLG